LATALAIAWNDKEIVGVIKGERTEYAADIARKSGVEFPPKRWNWDTPQCRRSTYRIAS
jgi:hypothetical protein